MSKSTGSPGAIVEDAKTDGCVVSHSSVFRFQVLGPLKVTVDGDGQLNLGGPKQRTVIALLIANIGREVSSDQIIEALYGEDEVPAGAKRRVQTYISLLRKQLGDVVETGERGWCLNYDVAAVDAVRFEDEVRSARSVLREDPATAARRLREALSMWRGPPYGELASHASSLETEARRLEELRLGALEARFEGELGRGESTSLIPDLEHAVAEQPLRERFRAFLVLALYRSGRQAEALSAYQEARRVMAEELGLQPSPELQHLEQAVLRQDPALVSTDPISVLTPLAPTSPVGRNPYKGLRAFTEDDAGDFFGREDLVGRLLERLDRRGVSGRLVVVAGASGSGKSSVVRAGLVPSIRPREWEVAVFYPGADPFAELAKAVSPVFERRPGELAVELRANPAALTAMADAHGHRPLLLIVDQLEEIFTLVDLPELRRDFLRQVAAVATSPQTGVRSVLTVRADFLDLLLQNAEFADLLEPCLLLVTPLADYEVRAAIVEPARKAGVMVQPELVAELIRDVAARSATLPLLQYALTDLFERRLEQTMTFDSYRAAGGVSGALARRADSLYLVLAQSDREAARQVFLRLVAIAETGGDDDLRRRVTVSELRELPIDESGVEHVLDLFGQHRLLTFDQDPGSGEPTVEVAHEAFLREWPRLRKWVDTAREDLRLKQRLSAGVSEWEAAARDAGYLLTGSRLAQLQHWAAETDLGLTRTERRFIETSHRRQTRRKRALLAGLMTVVVVVAALALLARNRAQVATARELAASALAVLESDPELGILLALEGMQATSEPQREVLEALHAAIQTDRLLNRVTWPNDRPEGAMMGVAVSEDGSTFATSADGVTIDLWETDTGEYIETIGGLENVTLPEIAWPMLDWRDSRIAALGPDGTLRIWDLASGSTSEIPAHETGPGQTLFSPDGTLLATAPQRGSPQSTATQLRVWNTDTLELLIDREYPTKVGLDFSPDSESLAVAIFAVGENAGVIEILDARNGQRLESFEVDAFAADVEFVDDTTIAVNRLRSSVDLHALDGTRVAGPSFRSAWSIESNATGSRFAIGFGDGQVEVFDPDGWERIAVLPSGHTLPGRMQFDAEGAVLVTGGQEGTGAAWAVDVMQGEVLTLGRYPRATGASLSPRGGMLALSTSDSRTEVWLLSDPRMICTAFETSGYGDPVFDPTGATLATFTPDGVVVWDLPSCSRRLTMEGSPDLVGNEGGAFLAFGPEGQLLAATGDTGLVGIWETKTGRPVWGPWQATASPPETDATVQATGVVFTGEGDQLVTAGFDSQVRIWNLDDLTAERTLEASGQVSDIRVGHNDEWVVAVGSGGEAIMWELSTGEPIQRFPDAVATDAVALSPDGSTLAVGNGAGEIRLWDVMTGREVLALLGHTERISSLDFRPNGHLVSASWDGTVRIWTLDTQELVEIGRDRVSRSLTDVECQTYLHVDSCPDG